jgi:hypothetical protein
MFYVPGAINRNRQQYIEGEISMSNPVSGSGQSTWSQQMQAIQQESRQESLVEMATNEAINSNNSMAQAAAGVGRGS